MGLLGAISGGLGLLGGITGFLSDKKQNKLAKKQLETERKLADRQVEISKYIEALSKQLMGRDFSYSDPLGGGVEFDEATGRYVTKMAPEKEAIQRASFREEINRMLKDQAIRRRGLNDFERMRERSSTRADRALSDIDAARLGIGNVNADAIGGQLRADRTRAINAGYDDAERAATTMQLRTGSSAVGDALANLARDRVRAQAEIGSPELEGMQIAEGINMGRNQARESSYRMFGDEARGFYDAGFTPAAYDAEAIANLKDLMKLDMSKFDLAMGGSGQAASTVGDAASTLRGAWQGYNQNRIHAPFSKFVTGLGNALSSFAKPGGGG